MSPSGTPDCSLRLADGRRLGYAVFGDPAGAPLLFLHGTPGSRLKFAVADSAGKALGLSIVAPDRWGYGLTEAPSALSLATFAADMAALMDHVGHRRFAVGGISGGGPYAAAVAACLGSRVTSLALISPVGLIADAGLGPDLPFMHRFCFTMLPRLRHVTSGAFRVFRWTLAHAPRIAGQLTTWRAARIDKAIIARREISSPLLGSFREGLRTGLTGPVIDLDIFSRPWGVDLARVTAPARLWIGTEDTNVPLAGAHALARAIGTCNVVTLPGEGHLWIAVHYEEVLAWAARVAREAAAAS